MMQAQSKSATKTNRSACRETSHFTYYSADGGACARARSFTEGVWACVQTSILFIQSGYCCLLLRTLILVLRVIKLHKYNLIVLSEVLSSQNFVTNSSSERKKKNLMLGNLLLQYLEKLKWADILYSSLHHTHNKLLGQLVRGIIHSWKEALCSCKKTIVPAWQQDFKLDTAHSVSHLSHCP